MFDFIRKHTKITMGFLFLLIVPSFVLFGLDGYTNQKDKSAVVAKVDGQEILQTEWDRAHARETERMKASMPSLDAKLLDSPEAKYATLERLVRDRVLAAAVGSMKLNTSDQRLARELQQNPEVASLRRPDGTLDMERYRQLLGAQGLSPEVFEANVRADLSTRQVMLGVSNSGFSSNAVADASLSAYFEKREVQLATFNSADFAAKLTPTDAELEQFYKANENLFQASEKATIEYVVLDVESLKRSVVVTDADLKSYYDQNLQRLSGKEERRASHILITAAKSLPDAERAKAKAKADELLALVSKAPDTFADVAKKNSQDPGSAPAGGDLDFFARDAMVKPFSDAAFAMKKGDISAVVESEFGFHIIKLTDIKAPKQSTFEEMKPELELQAKNQLAQKKFTESAESFSNSVYEQADSLKPVAERYKLELKTATGITRKPPPGTSGALANSKFLNAIFSPDATEKKRNTEAVEVASNQLVAGRVVEYTPARTQPFAEVKDAVRQRWVTSRGAEAARKEGAAKLAAWTAAPQDALLQPAITISRDQAQGQKMPPQLLDAALRSDAAALPAFKGVDLGAQGYVVVKVLKVLPRTESAPEAAKQERSQYNQAWSSAESAAYYNVLKEKFKTEIKVAKPARDLLAAQSGAENSPNR